MKRRLKSPAGVASSRDAAANAETVPRIKVWLRRISPMVWRRLPVPGTCTSREMRYALYGAAKCWTSVTYQRIALAGLVLIADAGEPSDKIIERQVAGADISSILQEPSRRIVITLESGETVRAVPAELAPLFRLSVQPYLSSWLPLDPAAELARAQVPVLIVQGTTKMPISLLVRSPEGR